jgi:23S rRNA (cytidine1920-2'-O)/16S rRNA (cytidine1409-2'-O)-methyltransferase
MSYVSRAGEKLDHALREFDIDVKGKVCADLGSSAGGFVDCLLQHGASKVYSVDTAYGELAWKLRNDPKVVVMERINALHVQLPESVDLVTIDVGWTRQEEIIPKALQLVKKSGFIISLVKPQYEVGNDWSGEKISSERSKQIVDNVRNKIKNLDANIVGVVKSPIKGKRKGSTEYLILIEC